MVFVQEVLAVFWLNITMYFDISFSFRKRKCLAEKYCCLKISLEEFRCTNWTTEVSVLTKENPDHNFSAKNNI